MKTPERIALWTVALVALAIGLVNLYLLYEIHQAIVSVMEVVETLQEGTEFIDKAANWLGLGGGG